AASATLLPPNLWTRVTASGRSAASADEAAEATASPVSWDADDMLWKLRVGLRVRSRWKPCGPHPVRVRSGVVDQSCTRARTPAPIMVPVVVIIVATATARVQEASAGRAQMAWVFGMGRHEYRTMMRCVKLRRLACNRNYRRDAPTLGTRTTGRTRCGPGDARRAPDWTRGDGDARRGRRKRITHARVRRHAVATVTTGAGH